MGTLFNQQPRNSYSVNGEEEIQYILKLSSKYKIPVQETIEILKLAEKSRENDLFRADGDIKDEQLSGFGELIQDFNLKLGELIDVLKEEEE
jgi:hypothetical protein